MTPDPGHDPDRYDPDRDDTGGPSAAQGPAGPLDPSGDPDRYQSPTLPGLLGEGAHEDERNNLTWLIGLISVFGFLLLVTLLAHLGNGG